jgi:hypothetical protein
VKEHILMGGDRSLNKALNQALKPETAKPATRPPTRVKKSNFGPDGIAAATSQAPQG